jgi:hypothetical protein
MIRQKQALRYADGTKTNIPWPYGLWMALNSAMRVCARVQIPVCPEPPLVRTSFWAGCVLGFWWFLLYELHVYSSMWIEAEALSEYGLVPE